MHRTILLTADQQNYPEKLQQAKKLVADSARNQVVLQAAFSGSAGLEPFVGSLPNNLTIERYPTNRHIELHLLLLQYLIKYSCKSVTVIQPGITTLKRSKIKKQAHMKHVLSQTGVLIGVVFDRKYILDGLKSGAIDVNGLRKTFKKLNFFHKN